MTENLTSYWSVDRKPNFFLVRWQINLTFDGSGDREPNFWFVSWLRTWLLTGQLTADRSSVWSGDWGSGFWLVRWRETYILIGQMELNIPSDWPDSGRGSWRRRPPPAGPPPWSRCSRSMAATQTSPRWPSSRLDSCEILAHGSIGTMQNLNVAERRSPVNH